ncbi:MAG: fibronectin type III domain-containing protein [Eubacterium sp.]|nr:fibronectin type III domain-containing protein [Eubacterium sp.]
MKRINSRIICIFLTLLLVVSCIGIIPSDEAYAKTKKISLSKKIITLNVDDSVTVKAKGKYNKIKVKASKKNYVTTKVSKKKITIKGRKKGSVKLTIKGYNKKGRLIAKGVIKVKVKAKKKTDKPTVPQSTERPATDPSSTMEPTSTITPTVDPTVVITPTTEPTSTITSTATPTSTITPTAEPTSTITPTAAPTSIITPTPFTNSLPIPSGLKVEDVSPFSVTVSWDAVEGVSGYAIDYSAVGSEEVFTQNSGKKTSYKFNNFKQNTEYSFSVKAYKGNGTKRVYSPVSESVVHTTTTVETPVFSLDNTTEENNYSITLNLTPVKYMTTYFIYRSLDGVDFENVAPIGASSTDWIDKSVEPGNTYYYKVRTYNERKKILEYSDYSSVEVIDLKNNNYTATISFVDEKYHKTVSSLQIGYKGTDIVSGDNEVLPILKQSQDTFLGWYDINGNKIESPYTGKSMTLYAKWLGDGEVLEPHTYTITFVDNKYGVSIEPMTVNYLGDDISDPTNLELPVPIVEKATFSGWFDENNNNIKTPYLGKSITLYATWQEEQEYEPKTEVPEDPEVDDITYPQKEDDEIANEILEYINAEREKYGFQQLVMDDKIKAISDIRAKEISEYYSHTRPDGRKWSTTYSDAGIKMFGIRAENLVWGYRDAEGIYTAWYNSSGHYANFVLVGAKYVGISIYTDPATGYKYAAYEVCAYYDNDSFWKNEYMASLY